MSLLAMPVIDRPYIDESIPDAASVGMSWYSRSIGWLLVLTEKGRETSNIAFCRTRIYLTHTCILRDHCQCLQRSARREGTTMHRAQQ